MNKRILVSESEKNSILKMHETFKNRYTINEDADAKLCYRNSDVSIEIVYASKGVTVNGKPATEGMTIRKNDKLGFPTNGYINSIDYGGGSNGAGAHSFHLTCEKTERQDMD